MALVRAKVSNWKLNAPTSIVETFIPNGRAYLRLSNMLINKYERKYAYKRLIYWKKLGRVCYMLSKIRYLS